MNTFLVKYENDICPCYGILERGNELLAIVQSFELSKKEDIVFDSDGFFEIQFASKDVVKNSLLLNGLPFGEIKEEYLNHYEIYPTAEEVKTKLDGFDYFHLITNSIMKYINNNQVVPLDDISYECMMRIYNKIMETEYKEITKKDGD